MRALITGGHGFVGRHLAQHLVSGGDDVIATYHPAEKATMDDRYAIALPNASQTIALDVADFNSVNQIIELGKPDAVYHLAAISFVPQSENDADAVMKVNAGGTAYLIRAILQHSKTTRLVYISSAEVYGEARPGALPLTEMAELRPVSNYGLSKCVADLSVFKACQRDGLDAVRVRPFPHVGPGQADNFALSSFARQLAEIRLGKREALIKVGNLDAKRDYSDVSDIVRGYRDALLNGKRGEAYNLCSGTSATMSEILQKLIKVAEVEVEIVIDPERVRPLDITNMVGSSDKAARDLGWKPRIDFEATLHSLFAFWLERLSTHG